MPRDPCRLALDGAAQARSCLDAALLRVAIQPALPLLVSYRQIDRAVPELRQVLDDPAVAREEAAKPRDARDIDQPHIIWIVRFDEEVAQVQITMMQARSMQFRRQV